jgi:predicted dehydrogenase
MKSVNLAGVCTATSAHKRHVAVAFNSAALMNQRFSEQNIHAVVITARHNRHASTDDCCLRAGKKHVFWRKASVSDRRRVARSGA